MIKMIVYFSILISECYSSTASLRVEQFSGLSSAVKVRYQTECLFLVNLKLLAKENEYEVMRMMKAHSKTFGSMVSTLRADMLNKTAHECKCAKSRPLFVVLVGEKSLDFHKFMSKMPSRPRRLIILEASQTIDDFLVKIHVPFNCEVLIAQKLDLDFQLTEVYQVAEDFPLNKRHFGMWTAETGLKATTLPLHERRKDLQGIVLKAVCMEHYPDSVMKLDGNQTIRVHGLYGLIWKTLEERLNFSTLVENSTHDNGQFGLLINGSWHGMISRVVSGDVDVALNGFSYQAERMQAVDFLAPIKSTNIRLIVRKPSAIRFRWDSFLAPFTPRLWWTVIGSILVGGALLSGTSYAMRRCHEVEERREADESHLVQSIFHVFGIYCAQGASLESRALSSRTVLLLAGLTSTVVVAAYSGALTSFITVQKLDLPYDTIRGYVDDPDYDLQMTPNNFWLLFRDPRNALHRDLRNRMLEKVNDMPLNRWSGMRKLCNSQTPFGWISPYEFEESFLQTLNCEIVPVPEYLVVDSETIIISKKSPFKRLFDHNLLCLRASGALHHMKQLSRPTPLVHADDALPEMKLRQVIPIFAVLVSGTGISVVLVALELARTWRA